MKVTIGTRSAFLAKDTVLAQGGEAVIHSDPNFPDSHVLKIYHGYDPKREQKILYMLKSGIELPESACPPLLNVVDEKNRFLGFQMRRLSNRFQRLRKIFGRQFNLDHGFTTKVKADIFYQIGKDLEKIHTQGIVIGDMNDANSMVNEENYHIGWVDVDSWSFKKFPCVVGTELYLSPDLYGMDLSKCAPFEPKHDWWSFIVLLIRALLNGIHVFKSGIHPHFQSVLERAEKGITVFDADVAYPYIGFPPEILSDDLLNFCISILKRREQKPFPLDVLKSYGEILIGCGSCGTWYPASRPHCPCCSHKTALDMEMMAKIAGFNVTTLVETYGRFLYYQVLGDRILCVANEGNETVVYRKDPHKNKIRMPLGIHTEPGARYTFFDDLLAVCTRPAEENPDIYLLDVSDPNTVRPVKALATECFSGGRAVFDSSSRFLYRIAGNTLLCAQKYGTKDVLERPVMQVFKNQTWFAAARNPGSTEEFLAGFHREFRNNNWFFVRGDADGKRFERYDVSIPQLENGETLLDMSLRFSSDSFLLARKTRKKGVDMVRIEVVSTKDGGVLMSQFHRIHDREQWDSVQGKGFSNGFVMHPTDRGILREKLDDGTTSELALTGKYISSQDSLERYENGVLVVKDDTIVLIERK